MTKTGEILRKAREAKGLSLNEVALSLKISSKILKAIEDGNSAQLPAKTFLRGFVQSYAIFLRLDVDSIMATFYEEMGSTKPKALVRVNVPDENTSLPAESLGETSSNTGGEDKTSETEKVVSKGSGKASKPYDPLAPINQTSNTKTVVITVVGAILIGLILFTKKMIDKYSREAQVESIEVAQPLELPPAENPQPPPPSEALVEKPGDTATASAPPLPEQTPSNMSVANPPTPPTPAPVSAPKVATPPHEPQVVTKPNPVPTPPPNPTPAATVKPNPSPAPAPVAVAPAAPSTPNPTSTPTPAETAEKPNKPIELIIEALDDVDIEYSSNAGKKTTLKLKAEQVHTFKSKNGLKLSISNGGAVNLILNGRDLSIPGDLGKPIKLSY